MILIVSASICKKKWNLLRACYLRTIRLKERSKYMYANELSFILPFYRQRKLLINTKQVNETVDKDKGDFTEDEKTSEKMSTRSSSKTNTSTENKGQTTVSSVMMEYNQDNQECNTTNQKEKDDVDKFFDSMAMTVKKLSPLNIALAKSRIFAIVSQLELAELGHNQISNSTPIKQTASTSLIPIPHVFVGNQIDEEQLAKTALRYSCEPPIEDY